MGRTQFAELSRIENNQIIIKDTDSEFLYHLQQALLLALREQGRLNPMQYRHADERLKKQCRDRVKQKQEEP